VLSHAAFPSCQSFLTAFVVLRHPFLFPNKIFSSFLSPEIPFNLHFRLSLAQPISLFPQFCVEKLAGAFCAYLFLHPFKADPLRFREPRPFPFPCPAKGESCCSDDQKRAFQVPADIRSFNHCFFRSLCLLCRFDNLDALVVSLPSKSNVLLFKNAGDVRLCHDWSL